MFHTFFKKRNNLFKKVLFIYFIVFLFSFNAVSSSCERSFSEHPFIGFAKEQLGKDWQSEMPRNWESNIGKYTKFWAREDTERFLKYLTDRIGEEDTLKRIKGASYFYALRYEGFIERVALYERYIGVEGVTIRLRKSLAGFHRGKVEEIEEVIKYLTSTELGLTERDIKESMKKSLRGFAVAKLSELKEMVKYLTGAEIGLSKEDIKESMKKDLYGFARAKRSELEKVVEFLRREEIGLTAEEIKESMKKSLRGFVMVKLGELKEVVKYLREELGLSTEDIKESMKKNLEAFLGTKKMSYTEARAFIRQVIFKEQHILTGTKLKEWIKYGKTPPNFPSDPNKFYTNKGWTTVQAFSRVKQSELKQVVKYLRKDIGLTERDIKESMKKDLYGFARVKLSELKEVVAFVEKHIGKEVIIEKMKKDLQSFSVVTISSLKAKELEWGSKKMKKNLEVYNLRNPLFTE